MDKIIVAYIENRMNHAKVTRSLGHTAKRFLEIATAEGFQAFDAHLKKVGVGAGIEAAKLSDLQKEFRKFFRDKLAEFEVTSPAKLSENDKIEFFNSLSKGWIKGEGPKEYAQGVLSQDDLATLWKEGKPRKATKNGVEARVALDGEKVETFIGGKKETTNVVKGNDMVVVKGPDGEEYAVPLATFNKQYAGPTLKEVFQKYKSTGDRFVMEYKGDDTFLNASWGEKMRLEKGDYLACLSEKGDNQDIYRIEKNAIKQHYKIKG